MNRALSRGDFVIDSHRGAFKNGLLENSIPAFDEAIDEGANMLECDLRGTRDGDLVLVHDRTIDHVVSHATHVPDPGEFNEHPAGKVPIHVTVATSGFMVLGNALTGSIVTLAVAEVDIVVGLCFAAGSVTGAQLGARLARGTTTTTLKKVISIVLVGLGAFKLVLLAV